MFSRNLHREPLRPLPDLSQDPNRILPGKSGSGNDAIATHHMENMLNRNHRDTGSLTNLKRANADVEIIMPRSPMGKENMVTFSNTLPRVNTPAVEESARRNATIHASMDSARSKQLLSQWKNKNESRKLSLQVIETDSGQSPPRAIEMRSSSEPSRVGMNGDHHGPSNQYLKIQPGSMPGCNSAGLSGVPRVSIQSRPGSSQLVHIPEETQENVNMSPKTSSARAKWLKAAEKTVGCRSNSQPRIMQVIAMSKQQGVLQGSPKGSDGGTVTCTGAIRYKTLTDHEPSSIVRVEAHPENSRPIIQMPSEGEGSGSWKWKAPEKGSLRQTYELNDLNRDSESSDSLKDSYCTGDRKRSNIEGGDHHHHGITTIRVTPVEGSEIGSETLSISSSRDSTLRRKGNIILIPERGSSPENTRNIFYKGTSPTRAYKEWGLVLRPKQTPLRSTRFGCEPCTVFIFRADAEIFLMCQLLTISLTVYGCCWCVVIVHEFVNFMSRGEKKHNARTEWKGSELLFSESKCFSSGICCQQKGAVLKRDRLFPECANFSTHLYFMVKGKQFFFKKNKISKSCTRVVLHLCGFCTKI